MEIFEEKFRYEHLNYSERYVFKTIEEAKKFLEGSKNECQEKDHIT